MQDSIKKLEVRIANLEKRVKVLEKESKLPKTHKSSKNTENIITSNFESLNMQSIVILTLYENPKQTRENLSNQIKLWGGSKKMINWFNGGNLKQRLVNTGIAFEDGINQDGKPQYSLTQGKGTKKAEEIIEKLKK